MPSDIASINHGTLTAPTIGLFDKTDKALTIPSGYATSESNGVVRVVFPVSWTIPDGAELRLAFHVRIPASYTQGSGTKTVASNAKMTWKDTVNGIPVNDGSFAYPDLKLTVGTIVNAMPETGAKPWMLPVIIILLLITGFICLKRMRI